uniref:serine--tRNA ligase, mitochondrial n=1 Tax=Ciona intestinalis TaxID=7719 RepID=UPI000180B829|nr:serine--tRNA ligase, mitochondrial [Ciona intestinalis]|eukprot:XP_002123180.1 serine--tRNA ligase, mitochondrial [Ciona intestinalis]
MHNIKSACRLLRIRSCSPCIAHKYIRKSTLIQHHRNVSTAQCGNNTQETTKESKNVPSQHKVIQFLEEEPEFVRRLNSDFAEPYTDISKLRDFIMNPRGRNYSNSALVEFYEKAKLLKPAVDVKYMLDNLDKVQENMKMRNCDFDLVKMVVQPYKRMILVQNEVEKYNEMKESVKSQIENVHQMNFDGLTLEKQMAKLEQSLQYANNILHILNWVKRQVEAVFLANALMVPNQTHPLAKDGATEGNVIETVGNKPEFDFPVHDHIFIGEKLKLFRQSRMSDFAGHRNYYLSGDAAELEQALIQYTLDKLKARNFHFISTPNILKDAMLEGAGVVSNKMEDLLYNIENASADGFCLAGTSEIGLAAYFSSHAILESQLPIKVCAVSTCYRKETGTRLDPKGLFRVHQFNKVEMFGVTGNESGNESEQLQLEFVEIQKELFSDLNLHYNVIDMPANDLGLPAFRKIDIEAWFPGRDRYDEISSASNCTDFQSRRLHILYKHDDKYKFAHTVNATACAVPRMIIALLENGQQKDKTIVVPECLREYMGGKVILKRDKRRKAMEYIGIKASKKNQRCLADF